MIVAIPASMIPTALPADPGSGEVIRGQDGSGAPFAKLLAALGDSSELETAEEQPVEVDSESTLDDTAIAIAPVPSALELRRPLAITSLPATELPQPVESTAVVEVESTPDAETQVPAASRGRNAPVMNSGQPGVADSGDTRPVEETAPRVEPIVEAAEAEVAPMRERTRQPVESRRAATRESVFETLRRPASAEAPEQPDAPVELKQGTALASRQVESAQDAVQGQSRPVSGPIAVAVSSPVAVREGAVVNEDSDIAIDTPAVDPATTEQPGPIEQRTMPEAPGSVKAVERVQQVANTLVSLIAEKVGAPGQDEVDSSPPETVEASEATNASAREVPQPALRSQSNSIEAPAAPARVRPAPEVSTSATRFVIVPFDAPDGGTGMLRVSVMGDVVRATMVVDAAAAATLERGLPELRRALDAKGYGDTQLSVRAAGDSQPMVAVAARSTQAGSEYLSHEPTEHHQGEHADAREQRDRRRHSRREDPE